MAVCLNVSCQAPAEELEQTQVISGTMKDAMHVNRLIFDLVEYQVVLDYEVSVSQSSQFFFLWDPTKRGLLCEKAYVLFNLVRNIFGCRGAVGGNVNHDLVQIVFSDPKKLYVVLRLCHGFAF